MLFIMHWKNIKPQSNYLFTSGIKTFSILARKWKFLACGLNTVFVANLEQQTSRCLPFIKEGGRRIFWRKKGVWGSKGHRSGALHKETIWPVIQCLLFSARTETNWKWCSESLILKKEHRSILPSSTHFAKAKACPSFCVYCSRIHFHIINGKEKDLASYGESRHPHPKNRLNTNITEAWSNPGSNALSLSNTPWDKAFFFSEQELPVEGLLWELICLLLIMEMI